MPQHNRRQFDPCTERHADDLPDNWRCVEIANSEGVMAVQRTDVDHYITAFPRTEDGETIYNWVLATQSDGFSHALPLRVEMTSDDPAEWADTREWLIQESHAFTSPRTDQEGDR